MITMMTSVSQQLESALVLSVVQHLLTITISVKRINSTSTTLQWAATHNFAR